MVSPRQEEPGRSASVRRSPLSSETTTGRQHGGVRIFSRSASAWAQARVISVQGEWARVEYALGGCLYSESVNVHSKHLYFPPCADECASVTMEVDPDCAFPNEAAAKAALEKVSVQREGGEKQRLIVNGEDQLPLRLYQNHSFVVTEAFRGAIELHYDGGEDEDVLLKAYVLEASKAKGGRCDDWEGYRLSEGPDGSLGYIHAMYHRGPLRVAAAGPFFLGLVVHRGLHEDWPWNLSAEDLTKQLRRSTPGGWLAREEPKATSNAREAHYVLSRATADGDLNNRLSQGLATRPVRGPHGGGAIRFCTDRSLGLGQHFDARLYLGKHGFGKSVKPNAWFEDYRQAVQEVQCGMLVLRLSAEYMRSTACRAELSRIPRSRIHVYVEGWEVGEPRIVQWDEVVKDPDIRACLLYEHMPQALGPRWLEPFREILQDVSPAPVRRAMNRHTSQTLVPELEACATELAKDARCVLFLRQLELDVAIHDHGREHAATADALERLGHAHADLAEYTKARELLERAVAIRRHPSWERDCEGLMRCLVGLGNAWHLLGSLERSREVLESALRVHLYPRGDVVGPLVQGLGGFVEVGMIEVGLTARDMRPRGDLIDGLVESFEDLAVSEGVRVDAYVSLSLVQHSLGSPKAAGDALAVAVAVLAQRHLDDHRWMLAQDFRRSLQQRALELLSPEHGKRPADRCLLVLKRELQQRDAHDLAARAVQDRGRFEFEGMIG